MAIWPSKDSAETLDYVVDWTARLSGDTIASSTWTVPNGITKGTDSFSAETTTVWLSGGVAGTNYSIKNTIVTDGGRTMVVSVTLVVSPS